jgi:hypothetical protein
MDGRRVTDTADLDPAAVQVIDDYLGALAHRLPAHARLTPDVVAEMRDDLLTATAVLTPGSPGPVAAARAALADFGDEETIAWALRPELAARNARRLGIALLVTGPLGGVCWLAAVFFGTGHAPAWRWLLVLVAPAIVIGAPATELTVASTGRLSRWLRPGTPLAGHALTIAGIAAGVGDLLLLIGCAGLLLLTSPPPGPLFLLAAGASTARLCLLGLTAVALAPRRAFGHSRTA